VARFWRLAAARRPSDVDVGRYRATSTISSDDLASAAFGAVEKAGRKIAEPLLRCARRLRLLRRLPGGDPLWLSVGPRDAHPRPTWIAEATSTSASRGLSTAVSVLWRPSRKMRSPGWQVRGTSRGATNQRFLAACAQAYRGQPIQPFGTRAARGDPPNRSICGEDHPIWKLDGDQLPRELP